MEREKGQANDKASGAEGVWEDQSGFGCAAQKGRWRVIVSIKLQIYLTK